MSDLIFDNTQAYREGWGLFSRDDGVLIIQRLDDPQSVNETYPEEPVFESDFDAVLYVMKQVNNKSEYHRKALELHGARWS